MNVVKLMATVVLVCAVSVSLPDESRLIILAVESMVAPRGNVTGLSRTPLGEDVGMD